jgi:hypothetical protein
MGNSGLGGLAAAVEAYWQELPTAVLSTPSFKNLQSTESADNN